MTIIISNTIAKNWAGRGYLLILAGSVGGAALMLNTTLPPTLGIGLVVLSTALFVWTLERRFPHRRDWQPTPQLFGLDLLHTMVSSHAVAPLVQAGLAAAAVAISSVAGGRGIGVWPHHWPVAVQLLLAIPLADFLMYWAHRLMHTTNIGWRVHAVHHSPTRLYFMASARSHPINAAIAVTCQFGTLLFLGAGPQMLSLWAVFMAVNGLLQHANINFQPRFLSRILATCDVHRAHHSLHESHCNYGNHTMIWDQVFGTYRAAPQNTDDVGAAGYAIPEKYLTHLSLPFALSDFESENPEP